MMDPELMRDPISVYGAAREECPVVRLAAPGFGGIYAVTRHQDVKTAMGDPRLAMTASSWNQRIPDDVRPYLLTMSHMDGPDHVRLRRLVMRGFNGRKAVALRPYTERVTAELLDELPARAENGVVDLLKHYTQPLPTAVVGQIMGIPEDRRPQWREYVTAIGMGGLSYDEALRAAIVAAKEAIEYRRDNPGDDLISDLLRLRAEDEDALSETELVTMVWHTIFAGQDNLANLIANAITGLLSHPDQLAKLRADMSLLPGALDELMRWRPPLLLTAIRYATEDFDLLGTPIAKGDSVVGAIASANHDPRVFPDPEKLDITRAVGTAQYGFGHGPHYCIGASVAQMEAEIAISALITRFPDLALTVPAADLPRLPNPGSWHLTSLPVTL
ncbi:cytochrome P450 [Actinoplanes missouriensis]|uniref:cytochrome P450 family protein n=1 Tax=Actinoplanes missouriensis TaxID=1866 RepID=UPI0033D0AA9C